MERDALFLGHILGSIDKIHQYTAGIEQRDFRAQSVLQDAVIRQLEIIGEAVKNISADTKARRPSIRWKDIAGMRDRLIHGYVGVDIEAVWLTVTMDIPSPQKTVKTLLDELTSSTQ